MQDLLIFRRHRGPYVADLLAGVVARDGLAALLAASNLAEKVVIEPLFMLFHVNKAHFGDLLQGVGLVARCLLQNWVKHLLFQRRRKLKLCGLNVVYKFNIVKLFFDSSF